MIRYLDIKAGIPGDITAFCYLFFEGCIGTIALIIYTAYGEGLWSFHSEHFLWVIGAGVLITIGLAFQSYALSVGIAGITFSIVNFSVAIQTVIGQVILGQMISSEQLVGVFICVAGACCVALSE